MSSFRIVVLSENTAAGRGILGEHGLSFWIESEAGNVLFDTGQGFALARNASLLGIPLEKAEAIVLSHGHYDHTGGLAYAMELTPHAPVFLHRDATTIRYAGPPAREVGMPEEAREALGKTENRVVWMDKPRCVLGKIHATGPVPRKTGEDTGGDFFSDPELTQIDPIMDDQSLWIETREGLIVLLGCCHAGLLNTLAYISEITGNKRFYAVMGGMHLQRATLERLRATADAFLRYGLQVISPAHCTGFEASAFFRSCFPEAFRVCPAGSRIEF